MAANTPNPQGKGLTPLLSDWSEFRPSQVFRKSRQQLVADYFTSMLVLSAEFNFKPVVGQRYFLYYRNDHWQLSLIEPERWPQQAAVCLGACQLHEDMTWTMQPLDEMRSSPALTRALSEFAQNLGRHVQKAQGDEFLPWYSRHLPYYRRLAASGLARSMALAGNKSLPRHQLSHALIHWTHLLPATLHGKSDCQ